MKRGVRIQYRWLALWMLAVTLISAAQAKWLQTAADASVLVVILVLWALSCLRVRQLAVKP